MKTSVNGAVGLGFGNGRSVGMVMAIGVQGLWMLKALAKNATEQERNQMAITSKNIKEVCKLVNSELEVVIEGKPYTFKVTRDVGMTAYTVSWGSNNYAKMSSKECYYFLCGVLATIRMKK